MLKDDGQKTVLTKTDDKAEEGNDNFKNICVEKEDRLYVLKHGAYLQIDDNELIIKKNKTEVYRRPISELSLVFT